MSIDADSLMKAHQCSMASITQFLADHFRDFGYGDPLMHAASVWSRMVSHDLSLADPKLAEYLSRNSGRIDDSIDFLIRTDEDFSRAMVYAMYLEWGYRMGYSTSEDAMNVLEGNTFQLLKGKLPEMTRSPSSIDPEVAIEFIKNWSLKWNKRLARN